MCERPQRLDSIISTSLNQTILKSFTLHFDEVCENENFLEQSEGSLGDVCLGRDTVDHTLDELASYNCCDTDI